MYYYLCHSALSYGCYNINNRRSRVACRWTDKSTLLSPEPLRAQLATLDPDLLIEKGIAAYVQGNYATAIQYYDRVLAVEPNNTETLTSKGLALSDLSNFTRAIGYYDKVLTIDPNDVYALNNKGLALYYLGNYDETYDKVLKIEPNNVGALNNKGLALYYLGNDDEAIKFYDKASAINSSDSDALLFKEEALRLKTEKQSPFSDFICQLFVC